MSNNDTAPALFDIDTDGMAPTAARKMHALADKLTPGKNDGGLGCVVMVKTGAGPIPVYLGNMAPGGGYWGIIQTDALDGLIKTDAGYIRVSNDKGRGYESALVTVTDEAADAVRNMGWAEAEARWADEAKAANVEAVVEVKTYTKAERRAANRAAAAALRTAKVQPSGDAWEAVRTALDAGQTVTAAVAAGLAAAGAAAPVEAVVEVEAVPAAAIDYTAAENFNATRAAAVKVEAAEAKAAAVQVGMAYAVEQFNATRSNGAQGDCEPAHIEDPAPAVIVLDEVEAPAPVQNVEPVHGEAGTVQRCTPGDTVTIGARVYTVDDSFSGESFSVLSLKGPRGGLHTVRRTTKAADVAFLWRGSLFGASEMTYVKHNGKDVIVWTDGQYVVDFSAMSTAARLHFQALIKEGQPVHDAHEAAVFMGALAA